MKRWAPHIYIQKKPLHLSEAILREAVQQATLLQNKGMPAVLTLRHLAFITGTPYALLRSTVSRECEPYRSFSMRKRSGGYRRIYVPNNKLICVQRWINQNILSRIDGSPHGYAFKKGNSVGECASQHLGCKWLIKIDVKSFFESISEVQAYRIFFRAGYGSLVAFEMARICTWVFSSSAPRYDSNKWTHYSYTEVIPSKSKRRFYQIEAYRDRRIGHLPQGAPTSPKLSDIAMLAVDDEIFSICNKSDLVFTRYADDISISSASPDFNRDKAKSIVHQVYGVLRRHGFEPNEKKLRVAPPGARKIVLGLLVDGEKLKLTKAFKRRVERHAYHYKKDSSRHLQVSGFDSELGFLNHLAGLLSYAREIDPAYHQKLCQKYAKEN